MIERRWEKEEIIRKARRWEKKKEHRFIKGLIKVFYLDTENFTIKQILGKGKEYHHEKTYEFVNYDFFDFRV